MCAVARPVCGPCAEKGLIIITSTSVQAEFFAVLHFCSLLKNSPRLLRKSKRNTVKMLGGRVGCVAPVGARQPAMCLASLSRSSTTPPSPSPASPALMPMCGRQPQPLAARAPSGNPEQQQPRCASVIRSRQPFSPNQLHMLSAASQFHCVHQCTAREPRLCLEPSYYMRARRQHMTRNAHTLTCICRSHARVPAHSLHARQLCAQASSSTCAH